MIIVGSDHAGFELKEYLKTILTAMHYQIVDVGTFSTDSVDYPDFGEKVGAAVGTGSFTRGIISCGSGIGISIAANKVPGVRAALAYNVHSARLSRQHNDANILVLPGKPLNKKNTAKIVKTFLSTDFEGGRHQRRVKKIVAIEKKYMR